MEHMIFHIFGFILVYVKNKLIKLGNTVHLEDIFLKAKLWKVDTVWILLFHWNE